MNVHELMSREPRTVRTTDRLDAAARVMWETDCGVVPVVDSVNVVVGMLTDRDVCMATYTQGRPLGDIAVGSAMAKGVKTCRADDTIASAMTTMQMHQIHRLPVVDARGLLVGILSTNDVLRAAHARPAAVEPNAVVRTLATIGAPRRATAPMVATPKNPIAAGNGAPSARAPVAAAATPPVVVPKPAIVPAPTPVAPPVAAKDRGKPKPKGKKG